MSWINVWKPDVFVISKKKIFLKVCQLFLVFVLLLSEYLPFSFFETLTVFKGRSHPKLFYKSCWKSLRTKTGSKGKKTVFLESVFHQKVQTTFSHYYSIFWISRQKLIFEFELRNGKNIFEFSRQRGYISYNLACSTIDGNFLLNWFLARKFIFPPLS